MNKDYILQETGKIMSQKDQDSSKQLALACAWVIANFKGANLKIYDPSGFNPLADFFVIGSLTNKVQAQSTSSVLEKVAKENKITVKSVEGYTDGEWILLDLGNVIVHLFQEVHRDIFDLDSLWTEYKTIEIPNEYYFSTQILPSDSTGKTNLKDYF